MTRFHSFGLLLLLLACSACGPRRPTLVPVHGRVLFAGQPAEGARVVFHPVGETAPNAPKPSGTVEADGSFTLTTFAPNDGAPPGNYEVAIVWVPPGATAKPHASEFPNRLPARYSNPKTSGLQAQVKDGPTEIPPFQLTK